jgi:predicted amidohydrolase
MRVTIGQINTTNGDIKGNVARIIKAIEQAKRDSSDLIVFPEITVQGYTSFDWFLDPDVVRSALDPLDKIIAATDGLTAIVGTVRPNDQPTGGRFITLPRSFTMATSVLRTRHYFRNMTYSTTPLL